MLKLTTAALALALIAVPGLARIDIDDAPDTDASTSAPVATDPSSPAAGPTATTALLARPGMGAVELPLRQSTLPMAGWTAESMAAARPLPLPRGRFEVPADPDLVMAPPTGRSRSAAGRAPQAGVVPDFARVLIPRQLLGSARGGGREGRDGLGGASAVAVPNARGSFNQDFTSSRLVPEDARVVYPYSAIGKLFFRDGGSTFVCSGSVISARLVMTAGHCVFSPGSGTHSDFIFVPAYHEGNAPLGVWEGSRAFTTGEWRNGGGGVPNVADFGVIVMKDDGGDRIGDVTGWLGYKTENLVPNHIHMIGYPGNLDRGQRMHQITTGASTCCDTNTATFGSDMRGGSSGSPWIQNFGIRARGQVGGANTLRNRIVGVTSFGFEQRMLRVQGSSIPSTSFVDMLDSACQAASGNCAMRPKAKKPPGG